MRSWRLFAVLVVLVLLGAFAYWLGNHWRPSDPTVSSTHCTVAAEDRVRLDREQLANAATIAATGVRLDMPQRAVVVALATAWQESKLRNLPHLGPGNDHDSIGLFQQRPSQGWGSEEQLSDPRYAAERFYQALREVSGWEGMRLTDAAQRVQRSAFPEAYQRWEDDADVLAAALLGRTGAAVTCRIPGAPAGEGTAAVLGELVGDWGAQVDAAPAPDDGTIQIAAPDAVHGWRYAHWLVSHADRLGITRVHYADLAWQADTGDWREVDQARDHVHAEIGA